MPKQLGLAEWFRGLNFDQVKLKPQRKTQQTI